MAKIIFTSLTLMIIILAGSTLLPSQPSAAVQSIQAASSDDALILAEMKKPPIKQTPTGGGAGGDCMSTYRSFYGQLRGESVSGFPTAPIPGTPCSNCLHDQSDFGRPWSSAARACFSHCCP